MVCSKARRRNNPPATVPGSRRRGHRKSPVRRQKEHADRHGHRNRKNLHPRFLHLPPAEIRLRPADSLPGGPARPRRPDRLRSLRLSNAGGAQAGQGLRGLQPEIPPRRAGRRQQLRPQSAARRVPDQPREAHTFIYVSTIQRMAINLLGKDADGGFEYDTEAGKLDIPINAFDVIIADECHRGYSAKETGCWKYVLDYFDAVKIGLTAHRRPIPSACSRTRSIPTAPNRPSSTATLWTTTP